MMSILYSTLDTYLIEAKRQVAVGGDVVRHDVRDDFLVRRRKTELLLFPVRQSYQLQGFDENITRQNGLHSII